MCARVCHTKSVRLLTFGMHVRVFVFGLVHEDGGGLRRSDRNWVYGQLQERCKQHRDGYGACNGERAHPAGPWYPHVQCGNPIVCTHSAGTLEICVLATLCPVLCVVHLQNDHHGHGKTFKTDQVKLRHVNPAILADHERQHNLGRTLASILLELAKDHDVVAQRYHLQAALSRLRAQDRARGTMLGFDYGRLDLNCNAMLLAHFIDPEAVVIYRVCRPGQDTRSAILPPRSFVKIPCQNAEGFAVYELRAEMEHRLLAPRTPGALLDTRWSLFDHIILGQPVPTQLLMPVTTALKEPLQLLVFMVAYRSQMLVSARSFEVVSVDSAHGTNNEDYKLAVPVIGDAEGHSHTTCVAMHKRENALCVGFIMSVGLPLLYGRQLDRCRLILSDGGIAWMAACKAAISLSRFGLGRAFWRLCYWHFVTLRYQETCSRYDTDTRTGWGDIGKRCLLLVRRIRDKADSPLAVQRGLTALRGHIDNLSVAGDLSAYQHDALVTKWLQPVCAHAQDIFPGCVPGKFSAPCSRRARHAESHYVCALGVATVSHLTWLLCSTLPPFPLRLRRQS